MTFTPRGAPELALSQNIPETTVNQQIRQTEAGACHFPVADKDQASPPGTCADGTNYIIPGSPSGLWTGKAKQIATAVGTNAANGWLYHTPIEGFTAYVQDENARYLYDGSAWGVDTSGGSYTDEQARDAIGAALVAGSNITITVNDPGDTITIDATGGGGGSGLWGPLVSIPTKTGIGFTTWLNQGSASATDFAGGIGFTLPSDGNELRGLTKAVPSTPYTITILAAPFLNGENGVCFGWYDGSSKAQVLNFRSDATVLIYDFSSPSVRNSGHDQLNGLDRDNLWMQISDNGTTVSFKISRDGFNFVTIYSVAKSSGYLGSSGYSNLFIGGCNYLTAGGGSVLSYS